MNRRFLSIVSLVALFSVTGVVRAAEDPFAAGVRATEPLTPVEQKAKFNLPAGFDIQLVATEPDINKPMNLAFDAAGRLWVTTSLEYPFPAPTNRPARDRLMIFEDFGPDGRARKITQFADGLNIPIGVYPFRSADMHWKAIVWSIPNIWLLEDTDGDGQADKRTVLYGPFDTTRDTHGNQASFRRGFDGWLYATHGFNNDSHVTARDGSHVDLNSGNTYRIRLDGSRIEQHTHGQVNPFGLAWDSRGNLYSSDCHSAPIYQLLDDGYYPSFGKPHDGLGFAPVLMEHAHGSTAIDGAFYYNDNLWPEDYQDTFFIGNVMTSRLNRDKLTFAGSTPTANERPDFLTTTDPWFRPVDNILGPDGALYIADFYNRIIGHYEVPLTHPGRDRERGRLWRVVYKGEKEKIELRNPKLPEGLDGLIDELGSPNLTRRLLAMNDIQDRFGAKATGPLSNVVARPDNAFQHVHALWLLHRLNPPSPESGPVPAALEKAARSTNPLIRVHSQRIAADLLYQDRFPGPARHTDYVSAAVATALAGLKDSDALVQRCAAEALGNFKGAAPLKPLLESLERAPAADTHLSYVLRKAVRDVLKIPGAFDALTGVSDSQRALVIDLLPALPTADAARYILANLSQLGGDAGKVGPLLQHAARFAPENELPALARFARERFANDTAYQLGLFNAIEGGLRQRGLTLPPALREWGAALVAALLDAPDGSAGWYNIPLENAPTANPWDFQERVFADGTRGRVMSSFPHGEPLTGILRSPAFIAPIQLGFWLCGHDGQPPQPPQNKNTIHLRAADSGEILMSAVPPRTDIAQKISWDLARIQGRRVYLEVTDGDTGGAYAWLAFGRIEPAVVAFPTMGLRAATDRFVSVADLAGRLGLTAEANRFQKAAIRLDLDPDSRVAAARASLALVPEGSVAALTPIMANAAEPVSVRDRIGTALAEQNSAAARAAVVAALKSAPYRLQQKWSMGLLASRDGADALLTAVDQGLASPRILQSPAVKNRLQAVRPPDWETRLAKSVKGLPSADEARDKLIAERRAAYNPARASVAEGERIFQRTCVACHQIDGQGGLVGPQLTGIGNRGLERLCEDILDPNRNVDSAFRTSLFILKDGEVESGLFRREEGATVIYADSTGKEHSLAKSQIQERRESSTSLMPDNLGETIPAADFNNLLAFLLSKGLTR